MRLLLIVFLFETSLGSYICTDGKYQFISDTPCEKYPICTNGGFFITSGCETNDNCTTKYKSGEPVVCIENACCTVRKQTTEDFSTTPKPKYVCGIKGHRFISEHPCGYFTFCANGGTLLTTGCVNDAGCSTLTLDGRKDVCIDNWCCTPPKMNEVIESPMENESKFRSILNFVWGKIHN